MTLSVRKGKTAVRPWDEQPLQWGTKKGGAVARGRHWRVGSAGFASAFWFAGWLFTLAYVQPLWWQAILAIVIWPYYLGARLR